VLGVLWLPYGVEEFSVGEMEVTLGMMLELFILLMLKPMVDILDWLCIKGVLSPQEKLLAREGEGTLAAQLL